jgi:hypothetical protein
VRIEGGMTPARGGVVVAPPASTPFRMATVNGRRAPLGAGGTVTVRSLPADVRFEP